MRMEIRPTPSGVQNYRQSHYRRNNAHQGNITDWQDCASVGCRLQNVSSLQEVQVWLNEIICGLIVIWLKWTSRWWHNLYEPRADSNVHSDLSVDCHADTILQFYGDIIHLICIIQTHRIGSAFVCDEVEVDT